MFSHDLLSRPAAKLSWRHLVLMRLAVAIGTDCIGGKLVFHLLEARAQNCIRTNIFCISSHYLDTYRSWDSPSDCTLNSTMSGKASPLVGVLQSAWSAYGTGDVYYSIDLIPVERLSPTGRTSLPYHKLQGGGGDLTRCGRAGGGTPYVAGGKGRGEATRISVNDKGGKQVGTIHTCCKVSLNFPYGGQSLSPVVASR